MREEDFFDVLGDIGESYIEAAHNPNSRKYSFVRNAKEFVMAACVTLLIVVGALMFREVPPAQEPSSTPGTDAQLDISNLTETDNSTQEDATAGIVNLFAQAVTEKQTATEEQAVTEGKERETEETFGEDAGIESAKGETEKSDSTDMPADVNGNYYEMIVCNDLSKDTVEFFGGSYLDDNGNFVIVLTEDTQENRTAICKELARSENATIFVSGTYTLEYLTQLQAKISDAMINKELPFVVSSGVYETTNNIVVTVTTTNEAELEKIYELDTIGGAIQVEYHTDVPSQELGIVIKTE